MTSVKSQKTAGALQKLSRRFPHWVAAAFGIAFLGAFTQAAILRAGPWNPQTASGVQRPGPVYVILWFDTEDYVLPQSDDSAKRIAEFLTAQGVHATFKVVGEKARTLERRHRDDVIAALNKHAIVYHSNYHSWRVTPAEFEQFLDWHDGVEEFIRREQPGIDSIRQVFGRMPTAYGQPGYSWCPEAQPALRKMGIHVYLDDGDQVGLNGKPYWYGGILNIYDMKYIDGFRPNDDWTNVEQVKANFKKAYASLHQSGGGLISIYFHPCEFIHKEFWDAVNFSNGAEPPRSEWKVPPMKSPEEQARSFAFLEKFVEYMKTFPVHFVTAPQTLKLYPDAAQSRPFSKEDLAEIARNVQPAVSFQVYRDYDLAASEVLWLLNTYVSRVIQKAPRQFIGLDGTPLGPSNDDTNASMAGPVKVPWYQFRWAVQDVEGALETNRQVPAVVWIGGEPYPAATYLVALAHVAGGLLEGRQPLKEVTLAPAHLDPSKYVAKNTHDTWDWPIFRPGFNGKHLLDLSRLQTWTLKPAQLDTAQPPETNAATETK
jgi:peptidoglycan/xylan/chitin deacetylase (PgdA/CDA1 family)